MLDLNQLDIKKEAANGAVLHLEHFVTGKLLYADDEKTKPWTLTLVGMDSDAFQSKKKEVYEKSRNSKNHDSESDGIEQLLAGTIACENICLNGKTLKLSDMGAIYKDFPWIAEQAIVFMSDRGNFIKA